MSVDDVREAVRYWRSIGDPIGAEPDFVEVTLTQAEALCDLADAARWLRDRHWEGDVGCDACRQVWPCETRRSLDAALARLDGEDTG